MWNAVLINEKEILLKHDVLENEGKTIHRIILTNFIDLWNEQLTDEDLIQRCKEMNPLFQAKPNVFINNILSLLDTKNTDVVREMEEVENKLILKLLTKFDSFKFQFQFNLQLQPPELKYKELTLPMLMMMSELQRQKTLLTSLLAKKDIEIAQYKLEGAELIRKTIQTEPFNKDLFNTKCLEGFSEKRSDIEQHPAQAFTISLATLYHQITSQDRQPTVNTEIKSAVEPETETPIKSVLNKKKIYPKKRTKPKKTLLIKPSNNNEVKTEMTVIKKEPVPAKKKMARVLLKNL